MSKTIRILSVLIVMVMIVAVGLNRIAWADRLSAGNPLANRAGEAQALARPSGTVITTPPCIETIHAGSYTIGSVAIVFLNTVAVGQVYQACIITEKEIPAKIPGFVLTSPIKLTVLAGPTIGMDERVCFPVPPGKAAHAFYWDNSNPTNPVWNKTEDPKNGQACVTVPAKTPSPTYVGLFQDP